MAQPAVTSKYVSEERLFVWARIGVCIALGVLAVFPLEFPNGDVEMWMYWFLLLVFALSTGYAFVLEMRDPGRLRESLMWFVPPDLVVIAGFTYLLAPMSDGFYPVVVLVPVAYALLLSRRQAITVAVGVAIAHTLGHALEHVVASTAAYLQVVAAATIIAITTLVSYSAEIRRERERAAARAIDEKLEVNAQLQRRIGELQAIREITDAIHSTLDFGQDGNEILGILGKALDIESCTLLVVDKQDSMTLFSATMGSTHLESAVTPLEPGESIAGDEHFSCMSVLDHQHASVMFCAPTADVDRLTEDDKTVLVSVANELVVAVENSRLYQLTARLAITDELTGLFNYRYLQNRLDDEIERAKRYDKRLSLLMIDADDFKGYNDTHGHMAGDHALEELATVLRAAVREVDLVARYGGEEFAIVLPETDAAGAYVVAEKVRESVSNHLFLDVDGASARQLTVSIGLATFPTHGWDKDTLLKEADDALYQAKHGGKNRVRTPRRKEAAPPRTAAVAGPAGFDDAAPSTAHDDRGVSEPPQLDIGAQTETETDTESGA